MRSGQGIRESGRRFRDEITVYRRVLGHPRTPGAARIILGAAIAYAISPVDLIPDFIPVLGHLDDIVVLSLLLWIALMLIPRDVVQECRRFTTAR